MKGLIFSLLILATATPGHGSIDLGRSPKAMLMGDAYTALADDEYALYYNPAILGRHRGFTFNPFNPYVTATNPLGEDLSDYENIGDDPVNIAGVFMDRPVHIGIGAAPGFKLGRFGLSAILSNQTQFNLVNQVTPMLDLDHRYDKGFVMGYGLPLKSSLSGSLSLGFSTKYIQRESLVGEYSLLSPRMLDAVESGEIGEIMTSLGKVKGSGWGFDAGLDYVSKRGSNTFTAGVALLDIYTKLHTDSNEDDKEVQAQPMQVNAGAAMKMDFGGGLDFTISGDIRNLEKELEVMRRVRLGLEVGLTPAFSLMGGINANQYSYGVKLNSGIISIYTGFFNIDIGEELGQQVSKRAAIYLSLLDFKFDG